MGIMSALGARPVPPVADGQNWDPENVSDIKRAHGNRTTRHPAAQAVVVTKCNPLRPEMVGTVNDEHGDSPELIRQNRFARNRSAVS
jgi:hypothetical protein